VLVEWLVRGFPVEIIVREMGLIAEGVMLIRE
jgi:hypothetical protein